MLLPRTSLTLLAFAALAAPSAAFVVGGAPPPARHSPLRTPCVAMQENPLARIFGGGDKKKKGGALSNGLDEVLKNAPLPVKLAAQLAKPLIGALETLLEEGQADTDVLLTKAESALRRDARVTQLLGDDVEIGGVFMSSSSNINGVKSLQLQAQLSGGGGTVALRGESQGAGGSLELTSLQASVGGQVIDVPAGLGSAASGSTAPSRGGGGGVGADGIIDIDSR